MTRIPVTLSTFVLGLLTISAAIKAETNTYAWLEQHRASESLTRRISPPVEYRRVETAPGTFADWLRHLPLKEGTPPVYLYNGRQKVNQTAHCAVVDIDVGPQNLQQCADALIRLRGEYLRSCGLADKISFNFTSGDTAWWKHWRAGYRSEINGNIVRWSRTAGIDSSYESFRKYMDVVFTYAGSYSLSRELSPVNNVKEMQIGDVFIEGGFPGHAVIIVDLAVKPETGEKVFLLAQSYMPAQDIHLLINGDAPNISPWYKSEFGDYLVTPEWRFKKSDLMRFR